MKNTIIYIGKLLLVVVLSAVVGMLLLTAAYSLPTWWSHVHLDESLETFVIEEHNPNLYKNYNSKLDGLTDAIMLSKGEYSSGDPLNDAIYARNEEVKGSLSIRNSFYLRYLDSNREMEVHTYPRYWHGYLTVLKPLLIAFNYMEIRQINFVAQLGSILLALAIILKKKTLRIYVPAFLVLFALQELMALLETYLPERYLLK